jgi:hypothetical protein
MIQEEREDLRGKNYEIRARKEKRIVESLRSGEVPAL